MYTCSVSFSLFLNKLDTCKPLYSFVEMCRACISILAVRNKGCCRTATSLVPLGVSDTLCPVIVMGGVDGGDAGGDADEDFIIRFLIIFLIGGGGDASDVSDSDASDGDVSVSDASDGDVSDSDASDGDVSDDDVLDDDFQRPVDGARRHRVLDDDVSDDDVSDDDVLDDDASVCSFRLGFLILSMYRYRILYIRRLFGGSEVTAMMLGGEPASVFALGGGGVPTVTIQSAEAVGDSSVGFGSVCGFDAKGADEVVISRGCGMLAVHPI